MYSGLYWALCRVMLQVHKADINVYTGWYYILYKNILKFVQDDKRVCKVWRCILYISLLKYIQCDNEVYTAVYSSCRLIVKLMLAYTEVGSVKFLQRLIMKFMHIYTEMYAVWQWGLWRVILKFIRPMLEFI